MQHKEILSKKEDKKGCYTYICGGAVCGVAGSVVRIGVFFFCHMKKMIPPTIKSMMALTRGLATNHAIAIVSPPRIRVSTNAIVPVHHPIRVARGGMTFARMTMIWNMSEKPMYMIMSQSTRNIQVQSIFSS